MFSQSARVSVCVFQAKFATDSRRSLPPIPRESCHPFQVKVATLAVTLNRRINGV
jgi:hypothetical protein